MSQHASSRSFAARLRVALLVCAALPLACAVATEPNDGDPETAGSSGSSAKAGSGPVITMAGSANAFGGTTSTSAGTASVGGAGMTGNGSAGTSAMAGKGGAATGGKAGSGSGGHAGNSSAGSGGKAGSGSSGGSGGGTSASCGALKAWKGGDSTLSIAAGEVVQWMGKRYKATAAIPFPNAECAPDKPAMWCEDWFTDDGDC